MPKLAYEKWSPRGESLELLQRAAQIITEYQKAGLRLTLRQLYYQFVARGWILNNDKSYGRVGDVVGRGRMAGILDWDAIEDRTRHFDSTSHWGSPAAIVDAVASQYRIDKWARQKMRPEVWIEKEALAGVFEDICRGLDVGFFACRGYGSQTALWEAGQRIVRRWQEHGQKTTILHFGDHDPSGMDMTRDIYERVSTFTIQDARGEPIYGAKPNPEEILGLLLVSVRRIALNMDQIEEHNPPPNPAKMTDVRAAGYVEKFGDESWELDALEPTILQGLVESEVKTLRDEDLWEEAVEQEDEERLELASISKDYAAVVKWLKKRRR